MIRHMDAFGVCKSGLLGYDVMPLQTIESVRKVNDFTADLCVAFPGRLFGFAFINPSHDREVVEAELDRCLQKPGMLAIKLEIDVNSRDRRIDAIMRKAVQYGVPVLHHSWYLNTWALSAEEVELQKHRSNPADIADLARRHPDARIIMAHMEGCGMRGILDIADCGNVWLDTSGSQPFSGTLEFAIETLGSERILFGTDMMGRGMPSQLGRIRGSRLSEDDRANILYRNAIALFGFDDDVSSGNENHRRERISGVLADPAVHR